MLNYLRKKLGYRRRVCEHAYLPLDALGETFEIKEQQRRFVQDRSSSAGEYLTRSSQSNSTSFAVDQSNAELILEVFDTSAYRRQRKVKTLGGMRKAALFFNHANHPEVEQVEPRD
jgi:hypothetical protein